MEQESNMRIKNYIKLFIILVILLLIIFVFKRKDYYNYRAFKTLSPEVYAKSRDKDDFSTSIYYLKENLSPKEFDLFIRNILSPENLDLFSIFNVVAYIRYNNKKEYLDLIKVKYNQLATLPNDSTWKSQYYVREFSFDETDSSQGLNYLMMDCINKLSNKK